MFADLDVDLVELAPCVPPAEQVRLREVTFRADAWLPAEIDRLTALFRDNAGMDEIATAIGRKREAVRTKVWELGLRRNSTSPWNELEERELVRRYGVDPTAAIASDLGRGVPAVYARAQILGLSEEQAPAYTEWEDAQIRAGYAQGVPVAQIATLIGRPLYGVASRAFDLRIPHAAAKAIYSDAEVAALLKMAHEGMRYREIMASLAGAGFPQRSLTGVKQALAKLGYGRGWGRAWLPDEDELLRRAYQEGASLTPLQERLSRTRTSIRWRVNYLGLSGTHPNKNGFRQGPDWSEAENARLREAYGKVPMQQLADELGRKLRAMYVHAHHLGLRAGYNNRFSPSEDRRIAQALAGGTIKDLAAEMGRDVYALNRRAKRLGLA